MNTELNDQNASAGTSRRTILQGAAWSIPVIAIAAAAPAAAASNACAGTLTFSPNPLNMNSNTVVPPGAAAYLTTVTVTLTGGAANATVDLALTGPAYKFDSSTGPTTQTVTLDANGQAEVDIYTAPSNVTANGAGTLVANISGQTPACAPTAVPLTRRAQNLSYESNFGDGAVTWEAIPGSNGDWSVPVLVRTVGGRRIYRTTYSKNVVATGNITTIPIGFYFRQRNRQHVSNQTANTTRFATVNGTQLQYRGPVSTIVNTNVPASQAPRP